MLNYSVQCLDIASYYVNYKIICKTILPVNQGPIQKIFYKNMTRSATLKINCTTINIIVKTTDIFTLQTFLSGRLRTGGHWTLTWFAVFVLRFQLLLKHK